MKRAKKRSAITWDLTPKEAIAIQRTLSGLVEREDRLGVIQTVAGIDVGFEDSGRLARAGIVVFNFPALTILETAVARRPVVFPYIPGLLSFREAPVILEALASLNRPPDLIFCDGQGLAHQRRAGLACHLGIASGLPSIGTAKSRLIGEHEPVGEEKGSWKPLIDKDEVIGAVLRTRSGVKPIFVSIGHRISLMTAVRFTLECTAGYRIPEPTRIAHKLASEMRLRG